MDWAAVGPPRIKVAREKAADPRMNFVTVDFMFRLLIPVQVVRPTPSKAEKSTARHHAASVGLQTEAGLTCARPALGVRGRRD
jgi:hypothetical protein